MCVQPMCVRAAGLVCCSPPLSVSSVCTLRCVCVCERVYRAMFSTFNFCVRCMDRHMTLKAFHDGLYVGVCVCSYQCVCVCVCARVHEGFVCVTATSQIPAFVSRCHSTWARRSFHSPQPRPSLHPHRGLSQPSRQDGS